MTAAIVDHDDRIPTKVATMPRPAEFQNVSGGTNSIPGQLWERVADRKIDGLLITPRLAYASFIVGDLAGERRSIWDLYGRGPVARDPYSTRSYQGVLSGIIRAGERVR